MFQRVSLWVRVLGPSVIMVGHSYWRLVYNEYVRLPEKGFLLRAPGVD